MLERSELDELMSKPVGSLAQKEQYIGGKPSDVALYLPLVALGLKTGALGTFSASYSQHLLEQLFDELGLYTKFDRYDESTYGVLYTSDEELISTVDFRREDEDFGRFLGVPDADNSWYEKSDNLNIPDVKPIPEYLGLKPSDVDGLKYARLVSWICKPTLDSLQRTIEIGKQWYEVAQILSQEYQYHGALQYADRQITQDNHIWYSFN